MHWPKKRVLPQRELIASWHREEGIVLNTEYPQPVAQVGEVRIKVLAAALNHRDVWINQGQYGGIKYPTILGSDGVGVVESLGEGIASECKNL